MKKIKEIIVDIIYVFLCLILGSFWIIGGFYNLFKPMYTDKSNMYNLVISLLSIVIGYYLIRFWIKRYKKTKDKNRMGSYEFSSDKLKPDKGKKIEGWLIWFCTGLFFNILRGLQNIEFYDKNILTSENIKVFSNIKNGIQTITSLKFGYYITYVTIIFFIILIILFFQKRKIFPKLFIILFTLIIIMHIIDYIIAITITDNLIKAWKIRNTETNLIISIGSAIIGYTYLHKSERVKNTFVK